MIKQPAWAKGSVPTERGWVRGKELLTCRRHTLEEIVEWTEAQNKPIEVKAPKVIKERKPRVKKLKESKMADTKSVLLTEAPISHRSINEMTKPQVEALERQYGIDIKKSDNQTLTESSDSE